MCFDHAGGAVTDRYLPKGFLGDVDYESGNDRQLGAAKEHQCGSAASAGESLGAAGRCPSDHLRPSQAGNSGFRRIVCAGVDTWQNSQLFRCYSFAVSHRECLTSRGDIYPNLNHLWLVRRLAGAGPTPVCPKSFCLVR